MDEGERLLEDALDRVDLRVIEVGERGSGYPARTSISSYFNPGTESETDRFGICARRT